MTYKSENGNIVLTRPDSFKLSHIFECGQAFRWSMNDDGSFTGIAGGKPLMISCENEDVIFHDTSLADFEDFWKNYFDLDTDYSKIKLTLSDDPTLKKAIEYGGGIRILRQELWECTVSFIISASNNIPRIKKIIELLCESFGEKIIYGEKCFYTFPPPERLASIPLSELGVIRAGFRDKYILGAAKAFASGEISAHKLSQLDAASAKAELMKIAGVGNKVADCIMLFSLARCDSFPIDVWIKRIMENIYFDSPQTLEKLSEFAKARFGALGGYAQQYLFFYARENKIGF